MLAAKRGQPVWKCYFEWTGWWTSFRSILSMCQLPWTPPCLMAHTSETEAPWLTWDASVCVAICLHWRLHGHESRATGEEPRGAWVQPWACSAKTGEASKSCGVVLRVCFPACTSHLDMIRDRENSVFGNSPSRGILAALLSNCYRSCWLRHGLTASCLSLQEVDNIPTMCKVFQTIPGALEWINGMNNSFGKKLIQIQI